MSNALHTHFSALNALGIFLAVLIWGTVWRLAASHLMASDNPHASNIGRAMVFQY